MYRNLLIPAGIALVGLFAVACGSGASGAPDLGESIATDADSESAVSGAVPLDEIEDAVVEDVVPPPDRAPELIDLDAPPPAVVRIGSIGVDAPVIPLGLQEDGSIEVPEATEETGWWKDGPEPGERGNSVILGHVDSYTGPAVFARLTELVAGDEVTVERVDGSSVVYIVEYAEQHDKESFPTELVYGETDEAKLRLVTCGGEFDREAKSYLANYIVFAKLKEGSDTRQIQG